MTENMKELSAAEIKRLLGELDAELERRNQRVVLYVVGGANIALALDARRSTKDIDAVVKRGFDVVFDAAKAVAETESGLGADWLNSDFTGGTPDGGLSWSWMDKSDDDTPTSEFTGNALSVELASPQMMLALKVLAGRDKDLEDIYLLMRETGIKTPLEVGQNLAKFTGRRIFDEQNSPGMPFHIDPKFAYVFDNAPEDLRPPPPEPSARRSRKLFGKPKRPRCTEGRKHFKGGVLTHKTRCARPEGHSGRHRFRRTQ